MEDEDALAQYFDRLNDDRVRRVLESTSAPVLTMSHFLPLEELLPPKHMLLVPNLPKASGSTYLAARISQLRPQVHVFGHSHVARDVVIHGVRYVQQPLDYPKARRCDGVYGLIRICQTRTRRWGLAQREPLMVYETPGETCAGTTNQAAAHVH